VETILEHVRAVMTTDKRLQDYSDLAWSAILAAQLRRPQLGATRRAQRLTKFLLALNACCGGHSLAAGYQEVSHRPALPPGKQTVAIDRPIRFLTRAWYSSDQGGAIPYATRA
jgi:hypothetical protein